jgi:serine/threonine protein kinase
MHKNELQVDGCALPRLKANTANEFLREQYRVLRCTWEMPCEELEREEVEQQEFALHFLNPEEAKSTLGIEASTSAKERFYLSHPDLRFNNIIVDDELHICGIIDWEFSVTVPSHAFLPPSWLTGYGGSIGSKIDISSEFISILSSRKHQSPGHSRLAQDWHFENNFRLAMAYIFLEPSNLVLLFYKHIYPKLYSESRDKVVHDFFRRFENQELCMGLERRLRASEGYTQYLKDHNLCDPEAEIEWHQRHEWVKDVHNQVRQLQGWSSRVQDELRRLDGERTERRRL